VSGAGPGGSYKWAVQVLLLPFILDVSLARPCAVRESPRARLQWSMCAPRACAHVRAPVLHHPYDTS
jgi:hypothetical protein